MEKVAGVKSKSKGKRKGSRYGNRYGLELKLRCVKLRLEEGLPLSLLSKESGASKDIIGRWVKAYQERGEAGLQNRVASVGKRRKLPGPVREKIVEIKKREPLFGVKRISHLLNRGRVTLRWCFFLEGRINDSARSVRRTVSGEALRKNARFKRWEIRLTPKSGSCFLISTIFSRTGSGSLRRLRAGGTPFRNPASPRS